MCILFMPVQSCDLIHASDWRALYVAWATRALYTFGQTPSFCVRDRGLGTRLRMDLRRWVYIDASASITQMESETDSLPRQGEVSMLQSLRQTQRLTNFRSVMTWHTACMHACMMPWGVLCTPPTFIYPRGLHKPTKREVRPAILVREDNTLLVKYSLDTWCKRYSDCRV